MRRSNYEERPNLLKEGGFRLSRLERVQIRMIRRSLEPGAGDSFLRWCQLHIGSAWITFCTNRLTQVHGLERLPKLNPSQSYICVSNHRSFSDLYVVTAHLIRNRLLPHRVLFPVRANFFYNKISGFFVNGVVSFFAMYPPIFRERRRQALNLVSLGELTWLLRCGRIFVGIHPEGTRNTTNDPYILLPAESGVGRVIHGARVPVIPVFINGLQREDIWRQVAGNFACTGKPVIIIFGEPVDFGSLLNCPGSPHVYRAIAAHTLTAVGELGQEEKAIRMQLLSRT